MPMLRHFAKDDRGSFSVEAALVVSLIIVPVLLLLVDVAAIGSGQAQVQDVLQYAVTYTAGQVALGTTPTTSAVTSQVQTAYGASTSKWVSPSSPSYYCVATGSTTATMPTTASSSTSCSSGNVAEQFMKISVQSTVTIPFTVPYLPSSMNVGSTGYVRTDTTDN